MDSKGNSESRQGSTNLNLGSEIIYILFGQYIIPFLFHSGNDYYYPHFRIFEKKRCVQTFHR